MTRLWPQGQSLEVWGVGDGDRRESRGVGDGDRRESRGVSETPAGFSWQHRSQRVLEVCNRWRIHTRWWEPQQAVWREYWKVVTDAGLLCLIYRDVEAGKWFLARVYD